MDQAKEMAKIAFEALEDKKGEDVCAIDISAVSVLADYFVIANGNSDSQVRALVENVEEKMHKAGYAAKETEGHRSGAWVLKQTCTSHQVYDDSGFHPVLSLTYAVFLKFFHPSSFSSFAFSHAFSKLLPV